MIIADLATATGPTMRGVRLRFLLLTLLSTALQAAIVVSLIPVFNALFGGSANDALPWIGLLLLAFAVCWFVDGATMRAGLELGLALMRELGDASVDAIHAMAPDEVSGKNASELRTLLVNASTEVTSMPVLILGPLLQGVLLVPMLGVALFAVAWPLAITALIAGALLFGALALSRRLLARSDAALEAAERDVDDRAFEFAWAQPALRAAGRGSDLIDASIGTARRRGFRALAWQLPGDTIFGLALQICLIAFAVVTGLLYSQDALTGPTAAALVVVLLRVVECAGSLQGLAAPLTRATATLPRIRDLVRARHARRSEWTEDSNRVPANRALRPGTEPPSISLNRVGYRYPDGTTALADLDLDLPAGGITVIVGGSGSGKSTLLDLIAGLREPSSGQVFVDDSPVGAAARREESAVVFQDTVLRRGSIAQNVLCGQESDDAPEMLAHLAADAGLRSVLDDLPEGWESPVGEGGATLSGGERQRVGLARALAKPAPVLLLDEATSALDPVTERTVVEAITRMRGSRTVVVVTHRPALVEHADFVVVLHEGRVVETGTVAELRATGGRFSTLWSQWAEAESWTL